MKKRVLLVDDTLTIRAYEKLALGDGYEFVEAENGRAALEAVAEGRPDVILLDYSMPELDGLQTLEALKKDAATRDIPVIMVTTQSDPGLLEKFISLGARALVKKPIDREELKKRVTSAVEHPA